jgi:hypothetical protein
MVDIMITTFIKDDKRFEIVQKSLQSLVSAKNDTPYRVFIINDGSLIEPYDTIKEIFESHGVPWFYFKNYRNMGLAVSMNTLFSAILALKTYYDDGHPQSIRTAPQCSAICEFVSYNQDDILYKDHWLDKCMEVSEAETALDVAFVTCHDAHEHSGGDVILPDRDNPDVKRIYRPTIRATHLFAPLYYWKRLMPIPRFYPHRQFMTQGGYYIERGNPQPGLGSCVDWYLVQDAPNAAPRERRFHVVIPGYITHIATTPETSTWGNKTID